MTNPLIYWSIVQWHATKRVKAASDGNGDKCDGQVDGNGEEEGDGDGNEGGGQQEQW